MTTATMVRCRLKSMAKRRGGYGRVITGVDPDQKGLYSLVGELVSEGCYLELPAGAVVAHHDRRDGDLKLYVVSEEARDDGNENLREVDGAWHDARDILPLHDAVRAALQEGERVRAAAAAEEPDFPEVEAAVALVAERASDLTDAQRQTLSKALDT